MWSAAVLLVAGTFYSLDMFLWAPFSFPFISLTILPYLSLSVDISANADSQAEVADLVVELSSYQLIV